jgi:hypothetical protein
MFAAPTASIASFISGIVKFDTPIARVRPSSPRFEQRRHRFGHRHRAIRATASGSGSGRAGPGAACAGCPSGWDQLVAGQVSVQILVVTKTSPRGTPLCEAWPTSASLP